MANDLMNLGALLAASGGSGGIANSPVFGIKGKKQKRMDPMQILGMLDKFMGGAVKGYQEGQQGQDERLAAPYVKGMSQGDWSPSMGGGQGGMGGGQPQPSYGGTPQGAQAPGPSGQSPSQLLPLLAQAGMTPQGGGQGMGMQGAPPQQLPGQSPAMRQMPQGMATQPPFGGASPMKPPQMGGAPMPGAMGGGGVGQMPPSMGGSQMPQGLGGPMGGGLTPMHTHAGINMPGGQGGSTLGLLQQLMQQRQQGGGQGQGGGGQGAAPFPGGQAASSAPTPAPGGASPASSGGGGSLRDYAQHAAQAAGMSPSWIQRFLATGQGESGWRNVPGDYGARGGGGPGPHSFGALQFLDRGLLRQAGLNANDPNLSRKEIDYIVQHPGLLNPGIFHAMNGQNRAYNRAMGGATPRMMAMQAPTGRAGVGVGGSSGREMGAGGAAGAGGADPRIENPNLPGSAQPGIYSQAAHHLLQIDPNISPKAFLATMKTMMPFLRLDLDSLNKEHKAEMDEIRASQAADKAEMLDRHRQEVETLNAQKAGEATAHHIAQEELSLSEHQRKEMETKIHQDKLDMDQAKLNNTIEKTQATIEIARGHLALANAKSERMSRHMDVTEQQGAQRVQQGEQRLQQGDKRLQQSDVRLQQGRERLDAQKERQQRTEEIKQLDKSIQEAQSQQREIDNLVRSGDVKDAKILGSSKEFQGQIEDLIAQRKQLVDQAGGSTRAAPPQAAEEPPPVNPSQRVQQQRQGKSAEQGYGGTEGQGGKQPVRVRTPEEASKLPKGTPIILPDGRQGVVP